LEINRASSRIDSVILGAVDMSADLRCREILGAAALHPLAPGACGGLRRHRSPGCPFLNLDDPEGLPTGGARPAPGWVSPRKASIHPNQIRSSTRAFTPDEKTIAKARKVCAAFEQDKTGLVVVDGELIELPVAALDVLGACNRQSSYARGVWREAGRKFVEETREPLHAQIASSAYRMLSPSRFYSSVQPTRT